ncbi:MAG: DUF4924 family protein [Bacteroides sp.]|nr:DUF4924 family protein [Bacteroides sp.]
MYISQKLKKENIAEYLLYMWQVEDFLRAHELDLERIKQTLGRQQEDKALLTWYEELIEMMRLENKTESGHLQIHTNTLILLSDLHQNLLGSRKYPFYEASYYKVLPFIVELRAKNRTEDKGEIEICFDALYGMLLLRLQQKEINPQTVVALQEITKFISSLATYYHKEKDGEELF